MLGLGRNIALLLRYDGSSYHGWQIQKRDTSVCGTVSEAIRRVTGEWPALVGCGRTDAGVHAKKYIANFRTESSVPAERLPYALNSLLPSDIAVVAACEASWDFHATFSCLRKEYSYRIQLGSVRDPFRRHSALFCPRRLDSDAMRRTAQRFVGRHDFSCVRSVGTPVKSTVRTVFYFELDEYEDELVLRVCADGFLYNMARAMAGTLYYAGLGKLGPEDVTRMLNGGERREAGPTLPPHGLCLTDIWYGENDGLKTMGLFS